MILIGNNTLNLKKSRVPLGTCGNPQDPLSGCTNREPGNRSAKVLPPSDDTTDFAPADYTDGRHPLEWQTKYPKEALKKIRAEGIYVATFSLFLWLVFLLSSSSRIFLRSKTLADAIITGLAAYAAGSAALLAGLYLLLNGSITALPRDFGTKIENSGDSSLHTCQGRLLSLQSFLRPAVW